MAFIRARSPGRTRVPSVTARHLHSPELARDHFLAFGLLRVQVQVCNLFAVDTEANKTASGRPHATASQMLYGKAVALMVRWDLPPTSWRRRYVGATRAAAFAPLEFVVCLAPTGPRTYWTLIDPLQTSDAPDSLPGSSHSMVTTRPSHSHLCWVRRDRPPCPDTATSSFKS